MTVAIEFSGVVWYWRGPAPFYFITVPEDRAFDIKEVSSLVTYGWGMIPAEVRIGDTLWTTALWPKDGLYVVPLKDKIRKAENISEGDEVTVKLTLTLNDRPR